MPAIENGPNHASEEVLSENQLRIIREGLPGINGLAELTLKKETTLDEVTAHLETRWKELLDLGGGDARGLKRPDQIVEERTCRQALIAIPTGQLSFEEIKGIILAATQENSEEATLPTTQENLEPEKPRRKGLLGRLFNR